MERVTELIRGQPLTMTIANMAKHYDMPIHIPFGDKGQIECCFNVSGAKLYFNPNLGNPESNLTKLALFAPIAEIVEKLNETIAP